MKAHATCIAPLLCVLYVCRWTIWTWIIRRLYRRRAIRHMHTSSASNMYLEWQRMADFQFHRSDNFIANAADALRNFNSMLRRCSVFLFFWNIFDWESYFCVCVSASFSPFSFPKMTFCQYAKVSIPPPVVTSIWASRRCHSGLCLTNVELRRQK